MEQREFDLDLCTRAVQLLIFVQVRYIIEASLMHAQLLNRTLVLPSFIYARACEYDM